MKMEEKPKHQAFPFEIVYEILANLPAKTLIRFRCVCKSWNSLISDSSFQREHYRRRLEQDPVLLITSIGTNSLNNDTHIDTLYLSTHDANVGTDITNFSLPFSLPTFPLPPSSFSCGAVQICRGLVCVALSTDVFVCNPATREIIALPPSGEELSYCIGFGYAAFSKEFKVLRFFRRSFTPQNNNYCEIFTLGTNEWREARCPPPDSFSEISFHAPFLHGAIHFVLDSANHTADDAIYAFDIESEQYTTIPFPEDYYVARESINSLDWMWQCLNEFRGSLYLTSNSETSMQLWSLKNYHCRKWVKEYVIDLPQMYEFVWGETLAIMGDGCILLKLFDFINGGQIFFYNPGDKTFKETLMKNHTATMYVESLLSLAL